MHTLSAATNPATSTAICFIDASLPDLAALLAGLPQGAQTHLIPEQRDGLQYMAEVVAGCRGIETLHLICHGAPGRLFLGNVAVGLDSLPSYASELLNLSDAMAEDGQWLIYGCEVAAGGEGRRFVEGLRLMTGLQVAAAVHKVGHSAMGGSWALDFAPGVTDMQRLMGKTLAVPQWQGVLGIPTILTASCTPVDNATGVSLTANIVIKFSENVTLRPFTNIYLKTLVGGTTIETFTFYSAVFRGSSGGTANLAGDTLTLNPFADLVAGTGYYLNFVGFDMGVVSASTSQELAAITNTTTYNFTTIDPAPLFSSAIVDTTNSPTTLTLTYNALLDTTNAPLASAFTVTVNGVAQATPTAVAYSSIATDGKVTLTLAAPVASDDIVTVSYTAPAIDNTSANTAIQGTTGVDALGLTTENVIQNSVTISSAKTGTLISTDYSPTGAVFAKVLVTGTGSLTVASDNNAATADAIRTEFIDLGVRSGGSIAATDYAVEINGSTTGLTSNVINFGSISAGSGGTALKNLNGVTVLTNAGTITGNVILSASDDDTVNVLPGSSITGYVDAGASTADNLSLHSSDTTLTYTDIGTVPVGTMAAAPWVFDLASVGATGTYRNFEQVWSSDNDITLVGVGDIAAELDISSGGTLKVGDTQTSTTTATGIGQLTVKDLTLEFTGTALGTVHFDLNSATTPGTTYDQIKAIGAVTAGGALSLSLDSGFTAAVGDKFTLIDNDAADPITGTFTGLAEGEAITSGAYTFGLSYVGGTDNNDAELTVTAAPPTPSPPSTPAHPSMARR